MRTYTVTEYDSTDIEQLENMPKDRVIELLEHIADGWLPQDYVCGTERNAIYSESQYSATQLQVAIRKAVELIK